MSQEQREATWIEILKNIMTDDQLLQMAQVLSETHALAVKRKSDQLFQIPFNDRGYPLGFNGSNWMRAIKPDIK